MSPLVAVLEVLWGAMIVFAAAMVRRIGWWWLVREVGIILVSLALWTWLGPVWGSIAVVAFFFACGFLGAALRDLLARARRRESA